MSKTLIAVFMTFAGIALVIVVLMAITERTPLMIASAATSCVMFVMALGAIKKSRQE